MRHTIAMGLALAAAGCASNWTRPNTSEAQFRQDVYACQQQAALAHRPAYQAPTVQPMPSTSRTDCTALGNSLSCTTRPGADTAMYAHIANSTNAATNAGVAAANQASAVDSCLFARGYRRG